MPRATLSYDLPDEQPDFRAAIAAREALAVLHEIDRRCREIQKNAAMSAARECAKEVRDLIPGELLDI